jgi:hypothetical protein
MGQVDDPHQAKHDRQSQGHNEQHRANADAVKQAADQSLNHSSPYLQAKKGSSVRSEIFRQ